MQIALPDKPIFVRLTTENTGGAPYQITVVDPDGCIWYWRELDDNEAIINLPVHPELLKIHVSKGAVMSTLICDLMPPVIPYPFDPEVKRNYSMGDVVFRKNYTINSPARMFTDQPIVEYNPNLMKGYPVPFQEFICWHEIGHQFFDNERRADIWATITFLNRGWGLTSAIYSLTQILGSSRENDIRMIFQHEFLQHLSTRFYA